MAHAYRAANTYQVRLTVVDSIGHSNQGSTTASATPDSSGQRFFAKQALVSAQSSAQLHAVASLSLGPEDAGQYNPRVKVKLTGPQGVVVDETVAGGAFSRTIATPAVGDWTLAVEYSYVSQTSPASPPIIVDMQETQTPVLSFPAPPATPPGTVRIEGPFTLWSFGLGGVGDPEHPTDGTLTAVGVRQGGTCSWTLAHGNQQLLLSPSGCSASVESHDRSLFRDDVVVQLAVDGQQAAIHTMTVLEPHRLRPFDPTPPLGGPGHTFVLEPYGWETRIDYATLDQFGDNVTRARISEEFGSLFDYVANNWNFPTEGSFFTLDGSFSERIYIRCQSQATCDPLPSFFNATRVRKIAQDWFVGSAFPDVRVQRNDQTWYLGFGTHENVVSPVQ